MSAQALLSVIAPSAPAPSKGATDAAASGFDGLLAAMLGAEATANGGPSILPADPAEPSKPQTPTAAGFLVSPAMAPVQTPMPPRVVLTPGAALEVAVGDPPAPALPTAPSTPVAPEDENGAEMALEVPPVAAEPAVEAEITLTAAPVVTPVQPPVAPAPETRPVETAPSGQPAGAKGQADPATLPPPAPSAGETPDAPDSGTPAKVAVSQVPITRPTLAQLDAAQAAKARIDQSASAVRPETPAPVASPDDLAAVAAAIETAAAAKAAATAASKEPAAEAPPVPVSPPLPRPAAPPQTERPSNAARGKVAASDDNSARTPSAGGQPAPLEMAQPAVASEPVKPARLPETATAPVAPALPDIATADASTQAVEPEPATLPAEHVAVDKPSLSQISRVAIEATAQIAAQIVRKLEGRSTTFEMALTPDELGRVDVKLDIDSDGRLTARLAFDNPLAATDLRGRADELRRQLEQAGFQLSDNALEFAERDSSSSAFDRGSDGRDQDRAFAHASRINAEADAVAQPPRWVSLSLSPSGVDLKV